MDKSELLDRIRGGRDQIAAQWAGLTDDEMTRPGMHDGWSVKDTIAHLIFWERRMLERLPALLEDRNLPSAEADDLNARVYAENRNRPLNEVLAQFDDLLPYMIAQLDALSDEDLNREVEGLGCAAVWEYIEGNAYGHYDEHMDDLRAWAAQLRAGRAPS